MGHPSGQDPPAHALADRLVTWFTKHGGRLSPDVQLSHSRAQGFHLRALRPLTGSLIAGCPLTLTLSVLNLDPSETDVLHVESCLQQCRGKIPDHILAYLMLIEQRNKAADSPWYAYIACLPQPHDMTTPLWFDDADMAFLAGTSLAPAAKERKVELHQQCEHAVAVMREAGLHLADAIDL